MSKPWRSAAFSLFLITAVVGSLFGDDILALSDGARGGLKSYSELLEVAKSRYGDTVAYRDLVYASVQGLLRPLDPHTSFLPPEAYERMRERQAASFYGLGILVGMRNSQLTVITPIEGTPASQLGLRAGDVISTIEGQPTSAMSLDEAVQQLKGPKDTQVTITLVRSGLSAPLEVTITRAEIPLNTVRYALMLDDRTGYFRLTDFSRSSGQEVADAIASLKSQGMKRLVLDLRNNGGGLLDQAIEVSDQFLPAGSRIVETRGRIPDSFQRFEAQGDHPEIGLPIVVLVNSGSASAAEILAGAIQDHDVGIIVGTPTWGKGLVQTVYGLSYDAALALTTAKYYTPSGRLIQRDYSSYVDYYTRNRPVVAEMAAEPGEKQVYFTTTLKREVYGGGGITPDLVVEQPPDPEFLQYLAASNVFFNFGNAYTLDHPVEDQSWRPDDTVIGHFSDWLVEQELGTPEELAELLADPATRAEIARRIRSEVFNSAFGNDAWYKVLLGGDAQVKAAIEAFDSAEDLLARRRKVADGQPDGAARDRSAG